jgi:hypothetical protein
MVVAKDEAGACANLPSRPGEPFVVALHASFVRLHSLARTVSQWLGLRLDVPPPQPQVSKSSDVLKGGGICPTLTTTHHAPHL